MSDVKAAELKAAVDRLRRFYNGEPYRTVWGCEPTLHGHQQRDERKAIDAYLALVPADDDIEITEQWLRRVGWDGPMFDEERQQLTLHRFRFTHYCGWNLWWAIGPGPCQAWERLVDDVKTRGQLRMIAKVHDIPLKEQP